MLLFRLYILKIHENRVIYKLCEDCKKKVDRNTEICKECGTSNFTFKFNCHVEFADYTDSLSAIVFDLTAHKLFGNFFSNLDKTASEINDLSP
jgi:RNA polymerase subunit RPABC4/transcription elongation factor Spt4